MPKILGNSKGQKIGQLTCICKRVPTMPYLIIVGLLLASVSVQSDEHFQDNKQLTFHDIEGYVPTSEVPRKIFLMFRTKWNPATAVAIQKARGAVETGLVPAFIDGASCPEIDSEKWAIDYSNKRPWPAIHKGIDIPQPEGTPIYAVAAGTVIGKFLNERNRKGIEIMLRHTPEQTDLPFWSYSQYTHLIELPKLPVGSKVRMGQEIGKTSNTGKMGRRVRRDALHFAILYSDRPEWTNTGKFSIPKDGYWMDPNAFYRLSAPYASHALASLAADKKNVPIPFMKSGGAFIPKNTKRIWPYICR